MVSIYSLGHGFTIDRVILSTNENPLYLDFWPVVAKAWNKMGIRPTLALCAPADTVIDETLGDVIRFEPIEGIPTGFYAQVIRLLLPVCFPNNTCLISDIDMLPLQKRYFTHSVAPYGRDICVVFRDQAYPGYIRYPMCYVAARGDIFGEIFGVTTPDQIPAMVQAWREFGWGWDTDELVMTQAIRSWSRFQSNCVLLGHGVGPRLDRSYWIYDVQKLRNGFYIDSHMIRPYGDYREQIDFIAQFVQSHENLTTNSHQPRKKNNKKNNKKESKIRPKKR